MPKENYEDILMILNWLINKDKLIFFLSEYVLEK